MAMSCTPTDASQTAGHDGRIRLGDHEWYPVLHQLLRQQRDLLGLARSHVEAAFSEEVVADRRVTEAEAGNYISARMQELIEVNAQLAGLMSRAEDGPSRLLCDTDTRIRDIVSRSEASREDEGSIRRKTGISVASQQILTAWFKAHIDNPYPDDDEKDELMLSTGLSPKQVNNWFVNARRRSWKRMRHEVAEVGHVLLDGDDGDSVAAKIEQ